MRASNDKMKNKRNLLLICAGYVFSGANCLFTAILCASKESVEVKMLVMCGAILLLLVILTIADKRIEMRGNIAAALTFLMSFALSAFLAVVFSFGLPIFLLGVECVVFISIMLYYNSYRRRV